VGHSVSEFFVYTDSDFGPGNIGMRYGRQYGGV